MPSRRAFLYAALAGGGVRAQVQDHKMFGDAEAYERFMGRWSRQLAPPFLEFAAIPETGHVLDLGTGTGALAFEIGNRSRQVQVTGVDPSRESIGHATRVNPFPDRIRFQVGDAQNLDLPDAVFSACVSLLVFNFIPDPARALREVCRVVKPKGSVSAAVWDYGDRMRMLRVFWDAAADVDPSARQPDERNMRLCRAGELSQLWTDGGLRDVHERPLEMTMKFKSFPDYWDPFLLGQGPAGVYVRRLKADRLHALRDAVKQRLVVTSENDAFSLPARVWAVRGTVPLS